MAKLRVLVMAPRLVEAARKILDDAGAEIVDMSHPVTEDTLAARNVVSYFRGEILDMDCVMNPAVLERGSAGWRAEAR